MALYPDIQTKIRMELDRVIGHGQLPTLDDRSRLPYVNAAIKETMRWDPVVPLCLPHFTSKEDVSQGPSIPLNQQAFPLISSKGSAWLREQLFSRIFGQCYAAYIDSTACSLRFLGQSLGTTSAEYLPKNSHQNVFLTIVSKRQH